MLLLVLLIHLCARPPWLKCMVRRSPQGVRLSALLPRITEKASALQRVGEHRHRRGGVVEKTVGAVKVAIPVPFVSPLSLTHVTACAMVATATAALHGTVTLIGVRNGQHFSFWSVRVCTAHLLVAHFALSGPNSFDDCIGLSRRSGDVRCCVRHFDGDGL